VAPPSSASSNRDVCGGRSRLIRHRAEHLGSSHRSDPQASEASEVARSFPAVSASFAERDGALRSARQVVLWFEHDLYDQLQLLQILATLSNQPGTAAEMICIDGGPKSF
jgi:hypothetical protein